MGFFFMGFEVMAKTNLGIHDRVRDKLGSVAGPIIQANERLSFGFTGGLLYCVSQ